MNFALTKKQLTQMGSELVFFFILRCFNQLLAIIGFVPDFSKYGKTNIDGGNLQQEVNLKGGRIVDHQFSRWFLNDPGFAAMTDLQYNLRSN